MSVFHFLSDVIALFLMWLFLRAAVHKLSPDNRYYYLQLMADYGVSSSKLAAALYKCLGTLELVVAMAMLAASTRFYATIIAVALLGMYLLGMTAQLIKGKRDLSCGCSGPNSHLKISWPLIIRNAVLICIALMCTLPGVGFTSPLSFAIFMTCGFMILFYSCVENLIANAQKISILRAY